MGIVSTLLRAATWWNGWWNGQTLNTQLFTWRRGVKVGEDDAGNVFYETKDRVKRWVIFNGEAEASRVSPDWQPPTHAPLAHKTWEKPHRANLTGTAMAHAPAGSLRHATPQSTSDYEAWVPE